MSRENDVERYFAGRELHSKLAVPKVIYGMDDVRMTQFYFPEFWNAMIELYDRVDKLEGELHGRPPR